MTASSPSDRSRFQEMAAWIGSKPWRAGLLIFVVSVGVRAALLPYVPLDPAFTMRWETAAVARQLLQTGEYANPYILPTGPTAHAVPFHTALMIVIIKLFGVTMAAEYARCGLTIVSFSTMYALLPWFANRFGLGLRAGFIGGLLGALNPMHFMFGTAGVLAEEFAAMALGFLMVASIRRWKSGCVRARDSLLLGVAWGAAFHVSPVLALVLAAFVLFELCWVKNRGKWLQLGLVAAGVILACAPWTWRNYNALGGFVFIRSNLGLELRMGNHYGVAVSMEETDRRSPAPHPTTNIEEARKVAVLGELEYMRRARAEALDWIKQNPAAFSRLTSLRILQVWLGDWRLDPFTAAGTTLLSLLALLGAWRAWPNLGPAHRAALLLPLLAFPLIYYITAYMPRYRVPIDWILLLLAGSAISSLGKPEKTGQDGAPSSQATV